MDATRLEPRDRSSDHTSASVGPLMPVNLRVRHTRVATDNRLDALTPREPIVLLRPDPTDSRAAMAVALPASDVPPNVAIWEVGQLCDVELDQGAGAIEIEATEDRSSADTQAGQILQPGSFEHRVNGRCLCACAQGDLYRTRAGVDALVHDLARPQLGRLVRRAMGARGTIVHARPHHLEVVWCLLRGGGPGDADEPSGLRGCPGIVNAHPGASDGS